MVSTAAESKIVFLSNRNKLLNRVIIVAVENEQIRK